MMLRQAFENSLHKLQDDILMLGDRVEQALTNSVQYLKDAGLRGLTAVDRRR